MLNLTPRKRAVLAAVVKTYLETGEPVGSKMLTELLENAPSSATLRNEMNELCSLGFLEQPHTSAGRVPTSTGYRFYLSQLMQPPSLAPAMRRQLDQALTAIGEDPRELPRQAAGVLSELTGLPAVCSRAPSETAVLRQLQLLPVGSCGVLLLVVTSDGQVADRLCRLDRPVTPALLESFSETINRRFKNRPLGEFHPALLQTVIADCGMDALVLMPLFTALFSLITEAAEPSVQVQGTPYLYHLFGASSARRMLSLMENDARFQSLLDEQEETTRVIFGSETGLTDLAGKVLVSAPYRCGDRLRGRIGLIGLGRMSYDQILPCLTYTADCLSRRLEERKTVMED